MARDSSSTSCLPAAGPRGARRTAVGLPKINLDCAKVAAAIRPAQVKAIALEAAMTGSNTNGLRWMLSAYGIRDGRRGRNTSSARRGMRFEDAPGFLVPTGAGYGRSATVATQDPNGHGGRHASFSEQGAGRLLQLRSRTSRLPTAWLESDRSACPERQRPTCKPLLTVRTEVRGSEHGLYWRLSIPSSARGGHDQRPAVARRSRRAPSSTTRLGGIRY